jgi:hypothetical protein
VQVIGEVQITSTSRLDSGSTVLPSRTVFDAAIRSTSRARLPTQLPARSLLVTSKNLGDVAVRDAQFFPQPGRNFTLRVETAW